MSREILIPVDGSESSWQALDYALEYHEGDYITVLYIIDPLEGDYLPDEDKQDITRRSEQVTKTARERFEEVGRTDTEYDIATTEGRPQDEIIAYAAEHDSDQIVMGSRGRSGIKRLLLGSVAEAVVRRSEIPVNIVR